MKSKFKICPSCELSDIGQKVRTCPDCGHKFLFKKGKYEEIKEWKNLKKGDKVILKKGSKGPYYLHNQEKILMGYRGTFTVLELRDDGIMGYNSNEGCAFLYMGPDKFIEDTGIYRRKYKIFKKI